MNLKSIKSILILSCIALVSSLEASSGIFGINNEITFNQVEKKYRSHVVSKGETAYSISKLYNVAVADLYILNPEIENGLKIGSTIKVPDNGTVVAPQTQAQNSGVQYNGVRQHFVKAKETLYSICKLNGITLEDIVAANPELNEKPLYVGQRLVIPMGDVGGSVPVFTQPRPTAKELRQHTVEPKETLYGISRLYNTTPEALIDLNPVLRDGLKQGMIIAIPETAQSVNNVQTVPVKSTLQDINGLNIGVIMPFLNKSEGQSARFLEYYEGFLLALQEMKAKGLSANVYVFDMGSETGTAKLRSLLDTYEMKNLDMVIGGVSPDQISIMSAFAQKQGIKYVIPFPTKKQEIQNNTQVFQVNTPHEELYVNVSKVFTQIFAGANVICITGYADDKKEFVSTLESYLSRSGGRIRKIAANQSLTANLALAIDPTRKNVIIPASGSVQALQAVLPALTSVTAEKPGVSLTLFGHTEWQTYNQYQAEFGKYDTYFYTPFYANDSDYKVSRFIQNYKGWYNNKSLINTYPKYGMLGYDTGLYFLTAYLNYGSDFQNKMGNLSVPSLQTPFTFERTRSDGGFMNNGFYLIHYKSNGSIDKIEYGK